MKTVNSNSRKRAAHSELVKLKTAMTPRLSPLKDVAFFTYSSPAGEKVVDLPTMIQHTLEVLIERDPKIAESLRVVEHSWTHDLVRVPLKGTVWDIITRKRIDGALHEYQKIQDQIRDSIRPTDDSTRSPLLVSLHGRETPALVSVSKVDQVRKSMANEPNRALVGVTVAQRLQIAGVAGPTVCLGAFIGNDAWTPYVGLWFRNHCWGFVAPGKRGRQVAAGLTLPSVPGIEMLDEVVSYDNGRPYATKQDIVDAITLAKRWMPESQARLGEGAQDPDADARMQLQRVGFFIGVLRDAAAWLAIQRGIRSDKPAQGLTGTLMLQGSSTDSTDLVKAQVEVFQEAQMQLDALAAERAARAPAHQRGHVLARVKRQLDRPLGREDFGERLALLTSEKTWPEPGLGAPDVGFDPKMLPTTSHLRMRQFAEQQVKSVGSALWRNAVDLTRVLRAGNIEASPLDILNFYLAQETVYAEKDVGTDCRNVGIGSRAGPSDEMDDESRMTIDASQPDAPDSRIVKFRGRPVSPSAMYLTHLLSEALRVAFQTGLHKQDMLFALFKNYWFRSKMALKKGVGISADTIAGIAAKAGTTQARDVEQDFDVRRVKGRKNPISPFTAACHVRVVGIAGKLSEIDEQGIRDIYASRRYPPLAHVQAEYTMANETNQPGALIFTFSPYHNTFSLSVRRLVEPNGKLSHAAAVWINAYPSVAYMVSQKKSFYHAEFKQKVSDKDLLAIFEYVVKTSDNNNFTARPEVVQAFKDLGAKKVELPDKGWQRTKQKRK